MLEADSGPLSISQEIESQPDCWLTAMRLLNSVSDRLPPAGARVLALGCGTSFFMAKAYAAFRESHRQGETDAAVASEAPTRRGYDAVIAISRSGRTTEVLQALSLVPESTATVGIVADSNAPVAHVVQNSIDLGFANERSIVQTRFATTALTLLLAHLGFDGARSIEDARQALVAPIPGEGSDVAHLVILGNGWTLGLAEEGALKCQEAAGMWSEAHPAMEYRHGPIAAATHRTLVWSLDPLPEGLGAEVLRAGARLEVASLDPLAELIRVQRLAVAVALSRGRNPDAPANLKRSVILKPRLET
jgi:CRISPR-associated protein Cas5a/b/c